MKEIRICEIRADAAAGAEQALRLEGRPIVYDQPTKINDPAGAFIEVIRAGALENADLSDARLLYNHDLIDLLCTHLVIFQIIILFNVISLIQVWILME